MAGIAAPAHAVASHTHTPHLQHTPSAHTPSPPHPLRLPHSRRPRFNGMYKTRHCNMIKDTPAHACTQTDTLSPRRIVAVRAVRVSGLPCYFLSVLAGSLLPTRTVPNHTLPQKHNRARNQGRRPSHSAGVSECSVDTVAAAMSVSVCLVAAARVWVGRPNFPHEYYRPDPPSQLRTPISPAASAGVNEGNVDAVAAAMVAVAG
jgi:hypothetical protein